MDDSDSQETHPQRQGNRRVSEVQLATVPHCDIILIHLRVVSVGEHIDIPLPEMTFGNNVLSLQYAQEPAHNSPGPSSSNGSTSWTMDFNGIDALAQVAVGDGWEDRVGGGVLVSMAEEWGRKRRVRIMTQARRYSDNPVRHSSKESVQLSDIPISSKPMKPHDWTYSSTYAGSLRDESLVSLFCSSA